MKKTLLVILCMAMILSLTACGNQGVHVNSSQPDNTDKDNFEQTDEMQSSYYDTPIDNQPPKDDMWSILPEISVTADSAFRYNYDSELGGMVVTDYLLESPKVRIPDYLESEPVVKVDLSACGKQLTELIMPDTVVELSLSEIIRNSLNYVNIPDKAKEIQIGECPQLIGIVIGKGITAIDNKEFYQYDNLTDILIPETVKYIGFGAFTGTEWLEKKKRENPLVLVNNILIDGKACSGEVVIPNGLKRINEYAFSNCKDVTSITIPDDIETIPEGAFDGCENLKSVNISDSVKFIDDYAFKNCENLDVSLSDNTRLTFIGKEAFSGCKNLKGIKLARGHVNDSAFKDCERLVSVTFYNDIQGDEVFGNEIFKNCTSLKSIEIPEGITKLTKDMFCNCSNLLSVIIPSSVTNIENDAFNDCTNLCDITMSDNIVLMDDGAFRDCESSANVVYKGKTYSMDGFLAEMNSGQLEIEDNVIISCSVQGKDIIIPDGVIRIGEWAFSNKEKIESVTIPSSVTEIENHAFTGCHYLREVNFSEGLEVIGECAFHYCNRLERIKIPQSVKSIADDAFDGCEDISIEWNGIYYDKDYREITGNHRSLRTFFKDFNKFNGQ